ncbi:patatin-like phospholipase family protein [Allosalinactinospora lopnorensis]|uniref:patatin-like phospholipase family protein n=1 Tax=Allosalinactinospora lopnorensis TaxID=1352348 RepID=UPI001F02A00B|nr:patatin-like phospholipase family protein [Allosalinactinospora lopnorensis]
MGPPGAVGAVPLAARPPSRRGRSRPPVYPCAEKTTRAEGEAAVTSRALVLGGGGITGIAWELGILAGLCEAGTDLTGADLVVGTSAGSAVGAQVTSGPPLEGLFTRQLRPVGDEVAMRLSKHTIARMIWSVFDEEDLTRARARIGRIAHASARSSLAERRRAIAARLPSHSWPAADLRVTAVNARTGRREVFERGGATLVEAVMASCAVPGVWPPVPVGGRLYIDGGLHSSANVDLAEGYDRVVVLAPINRRHGPLPSPADQLYRLPGASRTVLITPGEHARAAIGRNNLDPARRAPAARAGRRQAIEAAAEVARVWEG